MLEFCIIGSGVSGATIGSLLKDKFDVTIFDKAKGAGGRSSYKRFNAKIGFDHGLQYLSPRSKKFKHFTKHLIKKKILKYWRGNHEFLNKRVKKDKKHIKLIGVKGNNQISKYLIKDINCNFSCELQNISRSRGFWFLNFKNKDLIITKNLIITAPFPQTKKLLSKFIKSDFFKKKIIMNASITVLLITNKTKNKSSSYFTNDKILGWVSYENSKKRFKSNKDCWVLQSTFNFGKRNINIYKNKKKFYTNILIKKFKNITGINFKKIYFSHIHGWKYSSNSKPFKTLSYWDKKNGLGICGDWFGGPRFENGWESANDLFSKIVKNK